MDQIPAAMDRHLDVIQCHKGKLFLFLYETNRILHIFRKIKIKLNLLCRPVDHSWLSSIKCQCENWILIAGFNLLFIKIYPRGFKRHDVPLICLLEYLSNEDHFLVGSFLWWILDKKEWCNK